MESRHKIRALSTEVSACRAVLSYHLDLHGYTAVGSHGVSDSGSPGGRSVPCPSSKHPPGPSLTQAVGGLPSHHVY